jgi:F-type H+-transporting ATPase subunit alpha
VNRIREWERGFLDYARTQFPQVGDTIRTSKVLAKETEADLRRAIEAFNQIFGAAK